MAIWYLSLMPSSHQTVKRLGEEHVHIFTFINHKKN